MPITVIIHIANEEPIAAEIENLPEPGDTLLIVSNPRRRDGKDLTFISSDETASVVWPWDKIYFLEIMPSEQEEEIIGFVRE